MEDRNPTQYAAGALAGSAFIAVTQILTGVELDCSLRIALALFASMMPFQVILFFSPSVDVLPENEGFSGAQGVWLVTHMVSTSLILLGFGAMFWHLEWWLGILFVVSVAIAGGVYYWWAHL